MKRTRTSLLRRVVMWAAGVVLVLSVPAWVASLWRITYSRTPDTQFRLWAGDFVAIKPGHGAPAGWCARGIAPPGWRWWPRWASIPDEGLWVLSVPLWMPTIVSATVFGWIAAPGARLARRSTLGLCPACGYDLVGIAGPCPECGNEKQECKA